MYEEDSRGREEKKKKKRHLKIVAKIESYQYHSFCALFRKGKGN